jgi:hypothetical protein
MRGSGDRVIESFVKEAFIIKSHSEEPKAQIKTRASD